jgi:hypothetical protein
MPSTMALVIDGSGHSEPRRTEVSARATDWERECPAGKGGAKSLKEELRLSVRAREYGGSTDDASSSISWILLGKRSSCAGRNPLERQAGLSRRDRPWD